MIQGFYSGLSGIQAHQSAIDVTADNIANVQTVGFRSYTSEFGSLFDNAQATTSLESSVDSTIGVGTRFQATGMDLSQGSITQTDRSTDLAIVGDGWFGVATNNETYYTRAGNFTFDSNRDLVTPEGMYVLGTVGDNVDIQNEKLLQEVDDVKLSNVKQQEKIQLPENLQYPPEPTTTINFYGNIGTLNEAQAISAQAIDQEGNKNTVKLLFTQTDPQPTNGTSWDITATVSQGDEILSTQTGTVLFDETGALVSNTLTQIDNNGTTVTINLGEKYSGVTAIANTPITGSSQADGIEGGELIGYEINQNAEVIATFTNGRQSSVAQIAVYHFQNDQGLDRTTGTLFQQSSNSGEAFFYQNETGENILGSSVMNFALETSNVKLENGLTELIIYQRAYDANAKSITTADQMIQQALQMDA